MIISNSISEQYDNLCREILRPTLRKIALSFCVSTSDFYDTVHELSFPATSFFYLEAASIGVDIDSENFRSYDRILEVDKSSDRLYRIAKRLQIDQEEKNKTNAKLFSAAKIYDKLLFFAMASTYSEISEMLGDSLFNKLDRAKVVRSLGVEEKTGFSFAEFAMYACLYMAIKKSAVPVLNKAAETANQKKRLKGRMRLIKKWLFSHEYRAALIRTLLDLLGRLNEQNYSLLMEKHCRDYWLPEEKRSLKYLDYAMDHYLRSFPDLKWSDQHLFGELDIGRKGKPDIIPVIPLLLVREGEAIPDNCISMGTAAQVMRSCRLENEQVQIFQSFFYNIVPLTTLIAEGTVPPELPENIPLVGSINIKEYILKSTNVDQVTKEHVKRTGADACIVSSTTYQMAIKVFKLLDSYIDAIINAVASFLECLPESNIAGEQSLLEYLKTI